MSIRLPNSCFIHVPRTGGLWFGSVIESLGIKHQTLKGDIDGHLPYWELPDNWIELPSFSFVRHPLAWIKSRWSHALEINAKADHRHYGVHRLFDECVQPTFQGTVETILRDQPGIVGLTYHEMLYDVDEVRRTEDLPQAAYLLMRELEEIPEELESHFLRPPINSTSTMERYQQELDSLPESLVDEFLTSEILALDMWKNARG